jgi:ParB-like chromosome segregation protein Spo0J
MLNPAIITEEPGWNARQEGPELNAHIRQLADSIASVGVQEPVTVYMKGDTVVLTNGHCRLMAVRLAMSEGADIKSIPCRVEDRYSNDADRVLSLITRNSGKPLSPLEQSNVVKRLIAFGWVVSQIASKTGFSVSHVNDLLVLGAAPASVTTMVANGEVSATTAVKTIRKHKDNAPEKLLEGRTAATASGSSRVTEKHLKSPTSDIDWSQSGPTLLAAVIEVRNFADMDASTHYYAEAWDNMMLIAGKLELSCN